MNVKQFRNTREVRWRQLERLVRTRDSFRDAQGLEEFSRLYRQAASDLAYARTYFPNESVTLYLNQLVSTAYPKLYQQKKPAQWTLLRFFASGFPSLFRELSVYILLAFAVSATGALYGFVLVFHDTAHAFQLLPPSLVQQINVSQAGPHLVNAPIMSSTIMTHNMLVALEAFVGGITLGLFTLYALWQNGLILGVLAALFAVHDRNTVFWSLIVPHGVTELTAIFIAGGAGLLLAHYLAFPHGMSRLTALQYSASRAAQLFLGTIPMFVIAGTIEGFLTPLAVPVTIKFATAIVTGVLWIVYFSLAGRRFKGSIGQDSLNDPLAAAGADTPPPRPLPHRRVWTR